MMSLLITGILILLNVYFESAVMSIKNFSIPTSTAVFTSTYVMRDKHPVMCVSHSMDGEWMFQCADHGSLARRTGNR